MSWYFISFLLLFAVQTIHNKLQINRQWKWITNEPCPAKRNQKKKRDTKAADKPRIIENFYLLLSPEGRTINLCSVPFRFDQEIVQANKLKSRMMHCHGFFSSNQKENYLQDMKDIL